MSRCLYHFFNTLLGPMCLGIPGKVVRWVDRSLPFAQAEIEFDGIRRSCSMACVPEANEGDYVIVHAGIAITRIDPAEAERVLAELRSLDDDDGWRHDFAAEQTPPPQDQNPPPAPR
jgi:hydrogenase expression/formation protein HypC